MRMGLLEILVILVIILLIAGSTQIPKLAKSLKQAKDILTEDKPEGEESNEVEEETKQEITEQE